MVDYHDPVTIKKEFAALVKLWHVMNGIFIWEFITTLDYEWDVIRGRRPYRWTIWIYSLARVSSLVAVILDMIGLDTTTPINCQVWITFQLIFAYTGIAASTLLIVLRLIAIWKRNKVIIAIAMGIWAADVSFFIYSTIQLRSTWSSEANTCAVLNLETNQLPIGGSFVVDVALLFIMLIGLFHFGHVTSPASGLARVLWKQGLIWLLIATIAELPSSAFIFLNLNESMNLIFQMPALIAMTIAATRIYRSLVDYVSSDILHEAPATISELQARSGPVPPTRTEASVYTERYQYPTIQTSPLSSTSTVPDPHVDYKVHGASLMADVERGLENLK